MSRKMTEALRREIWKREISLYSWNGKIIKIPIPYVSSRYFVVKLKKPYTREMSMECYCLSIFFFFFQSGVSLNRKQQQQLVCSVEVRLEFFYNNSLSWWVILDVRTKSKCSRFSEFNNETFLSDTAWPFYSDVDLKATLIQTPNL